MRVEVAVGLALGLSIAPGWAQEASHSGFWKGKFEIHQYNFVLGAGHDYVRNKDYVSREVELWTNDYDLYQNPDGVAREELTHMNRNRSVEGPLDIRLLDYSRGEGLIFDKGGQQAIKGPLNPPASSVGLGSRRILGFDCEGTEYQWTTFQGAKVQLQRWSPRDSSFKVPLLQVEYFTDNTGALLGLTIRAVTQLQPVADLPASLFQPPTGLQVVSVPSIE